VLDPCTYLIDGYNAIRRTPGLVAAERQSLQGGRDALIQTIAGRFRHTPHAAIIVFDGDGVRETSAWLPRCRVKVVYTRAGESADAVIDRIAQEERQAGRRCTVYTDDGEVRTNAQASGSGTGSVAELGELVHAPDRYRARLTRHQAIVRRRLSGADDEELPHRRCGNPRRAPKRQRGSDRRGGGWPS
jgi:predicted RNA-binding protein with PIN domain